MCSGLKHRRHEDLIKRLDLPIYIQIQALERDDEFFKNLVHQNNLLMSRISEFQRHFQFATAEDDDRKWREHTAKSYGIALPDQVAQSVPAPSEVDYSLLQKFKNMSEQERSHCDREGTKIVQTLVLD